MIEPAVLVDGPIGKKIERVSRTLDSLRPLDPAAIGGDTQPAQPKPGRRDARYAVMRLARLRRRSVGLCTVKRKPGFWIGVFPKKLKRSSFEVLEKYIVLSRDRRSRNGLTGRDICGSRSSTLLRRRARCRP